MGEYIPKGGYAKYNSRRRAKERARAFMEGAAAFAIVILAFVVAGFLEGMV